MAIVGQDQFVKQSIASPTNNITGQGEHPKYMNIVVNPPAQPTQTSRDGFTQNQSMPKAPITGSINV